MFVRRATQLEIRLSHLLGTLPAHNTVGCQHTPVQLKCHVMQHGTITFDISGNSRIIGSYMHLPKPCWATSELHYNTSWNGDVTRWRTAASRHMTVAEFATFKTMGLPNKYAT